MDVWKELINAARKNKAVDIALSPGAQIRRTRRPRPGRPRILRAARWGHYAGYDPNKGTRPRCAYPGCTVYLKRNQAVGCSDAHTSAVVDASRAILERVGAQK